MPIVSGGGGAGGPAAGSYLPVANKTGVTVDSTTYDDTIKGSGKLTTLVWPADAGALAFALAGDAFPRLVLGADPGDYGLQLGNGTFDAPQSNSGAGIYWNGVGTLGIGAHVVASNATTQAHVPAISQLSSRFSITSGALPTQQFVSGAGAQLASPGNTRDMETVTPCTFNPGAATTATVTVALSPDNVTYSTVAVVTEPAGVALDGTILPINVRVPAGWYLKLTANAQAVLGLTTYY